MSAFADIVTQEGDLPLVWERFQLEGDPPDVDWNVSALLFLGFGESGTCPARFDGVEVDGRNVRMHIGTDGGPDGTSDYHPRTFVVEVGRDQLPPGGFWLTTEQYGRFVLATSPQPQPPTGPWMLRTMTAEAPQIDLLAEPSAAAAGTPVEVVLDNEDGPVTVSADVLPAVLERWEAQRWLPAAGQDGYKGRPAIATQQQEAAPGQRVTVATVDTTGLPPSWYGVRTGLSVSGRGGVVAARASFNITD